MVGIPRVLDTDAEDVIWALQTADALWKRGERVDAIVWLRRAAQSAGEMEDDDRALSLAREAAELTEWLTQNPPEAAARSAPPPPPPTPGEAVDEFLRQADEAPAPPPPEAQAPKSPPKPPSSSRHPVAEPLSSPKVERVPSAAEVHAGMLDPWAEAGGATSAAPAAPAASPKPPPPVKAAPPPPPPPPAPPPPPPPPPAAAEFDADEVITSAPPMASPTALRTAPAPASPPPPPVASPPPPPPATPTAPPAAPTTRGPDAARAVAPPRAPSAPPGRGVDLSGVEALVDLPDDARDAFGQAATVHHLAREEEVSGFALALVLEGSVDLSATIVDASAQRLEAGAILRARGTIGPAAPLRLVTASERSTVAVWDEDAVSDAFRTCPWVEDELRAAGDRFQALVGATMGPLGERLDPGLRAGVTDKLRLLVLAEHEVFAAQGQPIPGLLVVGAGELELLGADGAPDGTVLRAGDFLFPNEVLRAAPAPATVRASEGGALILLADRAMAQELLVTCPPLLEIFAGA